MQTLQRPKLTLDELIEAFSESSQDVHVSSHGDAYYCGRRIASRDENGNPSFPAIKAWCDAANYWPNVWVANDHGNVELYTLDGEALGGLV